MSLNQTPQVDARIRECMPLDVRDQRRGDDACRETDTGDRPQLALWNLYARVKYAAAKKSPREPGKRHGDLVRAAGLMLAALETCWRAGFKSEDMAMEMIRLLSKTEGTERAKICPNCGAPMIAERIEKIRDKEG